MARQCRQRPRGACQGPQVPQPAIGPEIGSTVVVAAVRSSATTTVGMIGGVQVEMMLDSGSSISLVRSDILSQTNITRIQAPRQIQLRTASGAELPIVDHARMQVTLGELNLCDFAIVDSLVVPVILGVDFLQEKELVLDFTQKPVGICLAKSSPQMDTLQVPMYSEEQKMQAKACAITVLDKPDSDVVNECAVPKYAEPPTVEKPQYSMPYLSPVIREYEHLFRTTPGCTEEAYHFIPTTGNPVRIPPRRIPAHYRMEVNRQIQTMLEQNIIEKSSSPWMAPAVFVRKKSAVKDAYPLPLPDEVQDLLSGSTMPFGLSGAPSSFQRLMDKVLRGLPFVIIYLDDILVHSIDSETHCTHLTTVFKRLSEAGLTLRGQKCHLGQRSVTYLGHTFSSSGMAPDPQKVQSIRQWPQPNTATRRYRAFGNGLNRTQLLEGTEHSAMASTEHSY